MRSSQTQSFQPRAGTRFEDKTMKEVTKEAFWSRLYNEKRDMHPFIVGNYPYTSIFKYKDGNICGKIVGHIPDGKALPVSIYFLA